MKPFFAFLKRILPHLTLILSLALITFFVIDLFNESMAFLNNGLTKGMLATSAVLTGILSVLTIFDHQGK